MLQPGDQAPEISLSQVGGGKVQIRSGEPTLLIFFEADCPTCHLTIPFINRLAQRMGDRVGVIGISQDGEIPTRDVIAKMPITFPVAIDKRLKLSRQYEPIAVPSLFLIDSRGRISQTMSGFDKGELNSIAGELCDAVGIAPVLLIRKDDGAPESKPGCVSRHLEPETEGDLGAFVNLQQTVGARASLIELEPEVDPYEYCREAGFADPLPVIPPTLERVERMLRETGLPPEHIVGFISPNYGMATVEKLAANAVMAGCPPGMMRVLIPLIKAACDEKFNLHGVQATTHFAAPLIIVNGPIRRELCFASGSNVFSNVARANSSLGRALQLVLANIGGARPGEMDMSTLGNPGKFSYCIAENEEENPWEPLHTEFGFRREQSAVTLYAAEPPHGVSEHNARDGRTVLRAISRALATVFSYRFCLNWEAMVILCPEHVKTLQRSGFSKETIREFLFDHTGIPIREFDNDGGEGTQFSQLYQKVTIDGQECYRKFAYPYQIKIVIAGGTAGKFSAVIGSWATGPRGSQMVSYPIDGLI